MTKTDVIGEFDEVISGIALPFARTPQSRGLIALPADTVVVSADSHWSLTDDIFYDRFPAHLKDRAPRLKIDERGIYNWFVNGEGIIPPSVLDTFSAFETVPGCTQIEPRLQDMDVEGVDQEIVFGNAIGRYYAYPDLEVREAVFRIYNEHLAETAAKSGGRFHGVGLINYWDMGQVRNSIQELQALGIKSYLLPQNPKGADGRALNYCLPAMEPLWAAAEEAGLPLCFHVGEFYQEGPGGLATSVMQNFGPFRKNLGELIFAGIFDRHPGLQVVFAEADLNWIPGALQTATMLYECYEAKLFPAIKHPPRHYWSRNCYATFMHDPVGMRMLDIIGTDRIMWSADYPHLESTFGFGWQAIKAVLDLTTEEDARKILGGTAMKVFNLTPRRGTGH
jgi:predicted TIM-barrel fold metal-dependent hydrolase